MEIGIDNPPRQARRKLHLALQRVWGGAPMPVALGEQAIGSDRAGRLLYSAVHTRYTSEVMELWHRLRPVLHERHWSYRQLGYVLDWRHWGGRAIAYQVREELLELLRRRHYTVELPLPPLTDNRVLITWRAELYFNQNN